MRDSSDLVKGLDDHVRVIYYAIMGLGLLLLAASLTSPARTYERPLKDLRPILHLDEGKISLEARLKSEIDKIAAQIIAHGNRSYQNGEPVVIAVDFGSGPRLFRNKTNAAWVYRPEKNNSLVPGHVFASFMS